MKKIYSNAEIKIIKFEFEKSMIDNNYDSAPDNDGGDTMEDPKKSLYLKNGVNP